MITNRDRSGYIGASDTKYVIGNWNTKSFTKWWMEKIGISSNKFNNKYTMAGNNYEHKIIDALNIPNIKKDSQFIKGKIRVNLDANTNKKIHEVKTYNYEKGFELKKHKDYVNQVQVQMFISDIHNAEIDTYGLIENDYQNYFNQIDTDRLSVYEIIYDENWINEEYKLKALYLSKCLELGKFPSEEEYENEKGNLLF